MNKLVFGSSGIPQSTQNKNTLNGIKRIKELNLGAMELAFVKGTYLHEDDTQEVKELAKKNNIYLTAHAPYFINLNSKDEYKIRASIERILKAARIASKCGSHSLVFHAAFYMGKDSEEVHKIVKKSLEHMTEKLRKEGIKIWLRPETMGKLSQFGSLQEIVRLSKEVKGILPCIDISHLHARNQGKKNTLEDFREILSYVKKELGDNAIRNMHFHCSGIEYNKHGERYHIPLQDSDFNYKSFIKSLKEFNVKGVLISESPLKEYDALVLKKLYETD